jgi:hypothetical protein
MCRVYFRVLLLMLICVSAISCVVRVQPIPVLEIRPLSVELY